MEIPLDRPPAVRKMKVLGPRQAVELQTVDTQRKQAKAMRDYNPTINAMAEAQAQMGSIIKTAEQAAAAEPTVAGRPFHGRPWQSLRVLLCTTHASNDCVR